MVLKVNSAARTNVAALETSSATSQSNVFVAMALKEVFVTEISKDLELRLAQLVFAELR